MEQSTLAEILGVEKEIRVQLDVEREQASRWLEDARREVEREHEAALTRLQRRRSNAASPRWRPRVGGPPQSSGMPSVPPPRRPS